MTERFSRFAALVSQWAGTPWAFLGALAAVVVWAAFGWHFHWSDTHQLVINTSTTIVTFLMVFLIQNTQNRDSRALHLKLDEMIRGESDARDRYQGIERASEAELEALAATHEREESAP